MKSAKSGPVLMVLALSSLLCGCAFDEAARYYVPEKYPPRDPADVQVFRQEPTRPYQVIADFQARRATTDDMRRKAAHIGADAVIITKLGGYRSRDDEWAGQDSEGDWYTRIVATAIRFTDSPADAPLQSPAETPESKESP